MGKAAYHRIIKPVDVRIGGISYGVRRLLPRVDLQLVMGHAVGPPLPRLQRRVDGQHSLAVQSAGHGCVELRLRGALDGRCARRTGGGHTAAVRRRGRPLADVRRRGLVVAARGGVSGGSHHRGVSHRFIATRPTDSIMQTEPCDVTSVSEVRKREQCGRDTCHRITLFRQRMMYEMKSKTQVKSSRLRLPTFICDRADGNRVRWSD